MAQASYFHRRDLERPVTDFKNEVSSLRRAQAWKSGPDAWLPVTQVSGELCGVAAEIARSSILAAPRKYSLNLAGQALSESAADLRAAIAKVGLAVERIRSHLSGALDPTQMEAYLGILQEEIKDASVAADWIRSRISVDYPVDPKGNQVEIKQEEAEKQKKQTEWPSEPPDDQIHTSSNKDETGDSLGYYREHQVDKVLAGWWREVAKAQPQDPWRHLAWYAAKRSGKSLLVVEEDYIAGLKQRIEVEQSGRRARLAEIHQRVMTRSIDRGNVAAWIEDKEGASDVDKRLGQLEFGKFVKSFLLEDGSLDRLQVLEEIESEARDVELVGSTQGSERLLLVLMQLKDMGRELTLERFYRAAAKLPKRSKTLSHVVQMQVFQDDASRRKARQGSADMLLDSLCINDIIIDSLDKLARKMSPPESFFGDIEDGWDSLARAPVKEVDAAFEEACIKMKKRLYEALFNTQQSRRSNVVRHTHMVSTKKTVKFQTEY